MNKPWEQILGAYATNTLTEEEKRQLFEAALDDQTLFDTLADEEALKALLADPDARQRILESLEASGNPQGAVPHQPKPSWFRRPSSLAWAGSIAAMGLALIFGWQLEKEWGPAYKQEQERERVQSTKEDDIMLRARPPESMAEKGGMEKTQQRLKRQRNEVAPQPTVPSPRVEPQVISNASKDSTLPEEASPTVLKEQVKQQEVKKERRAEVNTVLPKSPKPAIVQSVPQESRSMAPLTGNTETQKKDVESPSRVSAFADNIEPNDARSSVGMSEKFFTPQKEKRIDRAREMVGERAQQLLGGLSSKMDETLREENVQLATPRERLQERTIVSPQEIRYYLAYETPDGSNKIDIKTFSGDWSKLQLAIESNIVGYLYVLAALENGKWQMMSPEASSIPRFFDGAIDVRPYQPVTFALSQISQSHGKPQASTVTVLLSSTPVPDIGNWLGVGKSQGQYENRTGAQGTVVIDRTPNPDEPFSVHIPLPQ